MEPCHVNNLDPKKDEFYRSFLRNGVRCSLVVASVLARVAFKLSMPFLVLLVYLIEPARTTSLAIAATTVRSRQSRIATMLLVVSGTVLVMSFLKLVAYWNAPEVVAWMRNIPPFKTIKFIDVHVITLWEITSFLSAVLCIYVVMQEDQVMADIPAANPWRLRIVDMLRRLRWLLALYSIVCILIVTNPDLRRTLHFVASVEVFRVRIGLN